MIVSLFDRHPDRGWAPGRGGRTTDGIGGVTVRPGRPRAIADADVVITAASFGPVRQVMTDEWLAADALVVPVDYATYCAAEVARDAALFLVDEREQFVANRDAGQFDDYPDPAATLGEAMLAGTPRPATAGSSRPTWASGSPTSSSVGHPRAGGVARSGRRAALTATVRKSRRAERRRRRQRRTGAGRSPSFQ